MIPLVIIPARGGSKGVPRKNIKLLGTKPLIYYTIEAAQSVFENEKIIVSTDDVEIKEVVEKTGLKVPFIRPEELATDNAGTYEVLLHAIKFVEQNGYFPDTLILLQATSPFRSGDDIKDALKIFDNSCEMVVSVKVTKSNPYSVLKEENSDGWLENSKHGKFIRRQDCPVVYELNGAIYIIDIKRLKEKPLSEFTKIKKFVMNDWKSHDIDTMFDWHIAELIEKKYLKNEV